MQPSKTSIFMSDADWGRLVRYFDGTLEGEGREAVEQWLAEHPERARAFQQLRSEWEEGASASPYVAAGDSEGAVQAILARTKRVPHRRPLPATSSWLSRLPVLVAAVLLVIVPGAWWLTRGSLATSASAVSMTEHTVAAGQRATVPLPDGSTVLLAPGSTLRYPSDFSARTQREVELEGQGLFTVTQAAGTPFIVRTGALSARVLGTSFMVRKYFGDSVAQVIVAQGRVGVGTTVLGAGDVALGANEQALTVSRDNAIAEYLAWTEGRLVFSGTLLRDAIPELERWYGMTITVSDAVLLTRRLYLNLDTETPSQAATVIATAVEARSTMSNNHLTLYQR